MSKPQDITIIRGCRGCGVCNHARSTWPQTPWPRHPSTPVRRTRRGYTLIELLVVIGIIVLLLAIAVPAVTTMFSAGADGAARNIINGQLSTARALAMRDRQYTGVHFQPGRDRRYYLAIIREVPGTGQFDLLVQPPPGTVTWSPNSDYEIDQLVMPTAGKYNGRFYRCMKKGKSDNTAPTPIEPAWPINGATQPDGTTEWQDMGLLSSPIPPVALPDGIALGEVQRFANNDEFVQAKLSGTEKNNNNKRTTLGPDDFTSFTVLFDPSGQTSTARNVVFWRDSLNRLFTDVEDDPDATKIWLLTNGSDNPIDGTDDLDPNGTPPAIPPCLPVRSLCLYDANAFGSYPDPAAYLNENARFLPVSPFTGGLIRSSGE